MTEERKTAAPEGLTPLLDWLENLADNPGDLASLTEEERRRLRMAAGRIAVPAPADARKMRKALRRKEKDHKREATDALLAATGIRRARRTKLFATPPRWVPPPPASPVIAETDDPRKCYACKTSFREVHHFYDQMCVACAELNYEKRHQTADLTGRVALISGARVKIGYHAAIKLLRAGARVVVTTRFPRDAAARYLREEDFEDWKDRLEIHGLDLRHTPSVEAFAAHMRSTLPRLDYLLHNACQTVRRPPGFYRHLLEGEESLALLSAPAAPLLASWESLRRQRADARLAWSHDADRGAHDGDAGVVDPAALSQLALLPEDLQADLHLFPEGKLDADLQQVDMRERNSWRLTLAEVPTIELLEVQLVNAIAPFVLSARLKPLMQRVDTRDAHVVNVSAVEGQFYRGHKTDKHPHTNMAKAALNMLTRTSAADYVQDGIFMNSVDTGWITDEDPLQVAARKTEEHGFHPPLDVVDGAARICDPIFHGRNTGEHLWGLFLKDYRSAPW